MVVGSLLLYIQGVVFFCCIQPQHVLLYHTVITIYIFYNSLCIFIIIFRFYFTLTEVVIILLWEGNFWRIHFLKLIDPLIFLHWLDRLGEIVCNLYLGLVWFLFDVYMNLTFFFFSWKQDYPFCRVVENDWFRLDCQIFLIYKKYKLWVKRMSWKCL